MTPKKEPVAAVGLNERGQCPVCNRKPLVYKRDRMKYCGRCNRAFDIETGAQIANWAWKPVGPTTFVHELVDPFSTDPNEIRRQ